MRCRVCGHSPLRFCIQGVLMFETTEDGKPCGTVEVCPSQCKFWLLCPNCKTEFAPEQRNSSLIQRDKLLEESQQPAF